MWKVVLLASICLFVAVEVLIDPRLTTIRPVAAEAIVYILAMVRK